MNFGNLNIQNLSWGAGQVQSVWLGPAEVWSKSVPVIITATAGAHVTEVTGSGEYVVGDPVTLTATVESEYIFDGWYDGSTLISSDNPYMFVAATDLTLSAVGKVDERTIPLTFTAQTAGAVVSLNNRGTPPWTGSYSTDNITWTPYTFNTNITLANVGDKVYFKGTQTGDFGSYSNRLGFTMSGSIAASGSIMSLVCGDNFATATTIPYNNAFIQLFAYTCTGLTTPPALPATNLTDGCYTSMFSRCSNLRKVPKLPATTLKESCYSRMFQRCNSLTSIPVDYLPVTNLVNTCYSGMFQWCGNITTLPVLPATNLANYCYASMFSGCNSLTSIPANLLPATNLANSCYEYMFQGCNSLTSIPANLLPATNLTNNCYCMMFQGCENLKTIPANLLPATNLAEDCYDYMFAGCNSLTTIPGNLLPATNLAEDCYRYMFRECANLKTIPANLLPATNLNYACYDNMFCGCTNLTTIPANLLPATNLASCCYDNMFNACTNLTTAPALPATNLDGGCYDNMFNGCTSLIVSDTSGTGYSNAWRIPASGTFTGTTYAQTNMFVNCATGSGRASDDMPGTVGSSFTYYTQNKPII